MFDHTYIYTLFHAVCTSQALYLMIPLIDSIKDQGLHIKQEDEVCTDIVHGRLLTSVGPYPVSGHLAISVLVTICTFLHFFCCKESVLGISKSPPDYPMII